MKYKILENLGIYIFLVVFFELTFRGILNSSGELLYTIISVGMVSLMILAFYYLNKDEIVEMFKLYKKNWHVNIKKNILTWIIGLIIMMFANYLILILLDKLPVNEITVRDNYEHYLIASIIGNIILGPILEEFVFRLGFNQIKNKYWFLLLSSFIFGLFHILGSIVNIISFIHILPYFILGIVFGIVYYRSENVFDSIFIHALHNGFALLLYFIL